MPLNEIEQHPYLNYFINYNNNNVDWAKYTRLFIGSFPIYQITKTIYPDLLMADRSVINKEGIWNFFYGSKKNDFWNYLFRSFNDFTFSRVLKESDLMGFLEKNNILVTDAIFQTNRYKIRDKKNPEKRKEILESPDDSALMNTSCESETESLFQLNERIIDWLKHAKKIDSIYFTAQGIEGKTPGGWFFEILKSSNINFSLSDIHTYSKVCTIGDGIDRDIHLFFLPTPASSRSISLGAKKRLTLFENYLWKNHYADMKKFEAKNFKLNSRDKNKLAPIRGAFLKELWYEFVFNKNINYNG